MASTAPWYVIVWRLPWFILVQALRIPIFIAVLCGWGARAAERWWEASK